MDKKENKKWFKDIKIKINQKSAFYIIGAVMYAVSAYNFFSSNTSIGIMFLALGSMFFGLASNSKEE